MPQVEPHGYLMNPKTYAMNIHELLKLPSIDFAGRMQPYFFLSWGRPQLVGEYVATCAGQELQKQYDSPV